MQADEHREFWDNLSDDEFFGNKLTHLYFYSDVTDESVIVLRADVLAACQGTKGPSGVFMQPKPILIHVHSGGGSVYSEQWLLSLFNQVHVPLCVMVDSLSASAATALTVMAPYRVAHRYSMSLLHDYFAFPFGKREDLLAQIRETERYRELYKNLYLKRTRISEDDMEALLRRDIWLPSSTCLDYGIYDRVIDPDTSRHVNRFLTKISRLPREIPFMKHNWNKVYASCLADTPVKFDDILASDEAKPVIYTASSGMSCKDAQLSITMIPRIMSSKVPVYGIIDNEITWFQMLPILFCTRRYMYENAVLDSRLVYHRSWGTRLNDIIHNAKATESMILDVCARRARLSKAFLSKLFDQRMFINAQECLELGLVDEIVPLNIGYDSNTRKGRAEKIKHRSRS